MKRLSIFLMLFFVMSALSACGEQTPPQPNELQTPQYSISLLPEKELEQVPAEEIHSGEGIKVIGGESQAPITDEQVAAAFASLTPDTLWEQDATVTYNAFTLPEKAAFSENGNVGVLSIPTLGLTVSVYEATDEMEAMTMGAAHFKSTSAWDGNVGISGHNVNFDGTDGYFKNLYKLKTGDSIGYETALGSRSYTVSSVKTISQEDWSGLSRSTENQLTLITCISGQPTKRLLVKAVEKS